MCEKKKGGDRLGANLRIVLTDCSAISSYTFTESLHKYTTFGFLLCSCSAPGPKKRARECTEPKSEQKATCSSSYFLALYTMAREYPVRFRAQQPRNLFVDLFFLRRGERQYVLPLTGDYSLSLHLHSTLLAPICLIVLNRVEPVERKPFGKKRKKRRRELIEVWKRARVLSRCAYTELQVSETPVVDPMHRAGSYTYEISRTLPRRGNSFIRQANHVAKWHELYMLHIYIYI